LLDTQLEVGLLFLSIQYNTGVFRYVSPPLKNFHFLLMDRRKQAVHSFEEGGSWVTPALYLAAFADS
jgi:hypothetical protein